MSSQKPMFSVFKSNKSPSKNDAKRPLFNDETTVTTPIKRSKSDPSSRSLLVSPSGTCISTNKPMKNLGINKKIYNDPIHHNISFDGKSESTEYFLRT